MNVDIACIQNKHKNKKATYLSALEAIGIDGNRGASGLFDAGDISTELLQTIDKVGDGTLPHTRDSIQNELALAHAKSGGKWSHGRAGISQEQLTCFVAAKRRIDGSGLASHSDCGRIVGIALDGHLHLIQGLEHVSDVVGFEQILHLGLAIRQGGEEEASIRQRLGSRESHGTIERFDGSNGESIGSLVDSSHGQTGGGR